MSTKPLLDKLRELVEVDRSLSFDSQNPEIYRQRSSLLEVLGCQSLANYDEEIYSYLTQRKNISTTSSHI